MSQERLEGLIFLSSEKDITINIDEAIDRFACSSNLLKLMLLFK